jgi:drug/metabolite transporter (DMT)-like permease
VTYLIPLFGMLWGLVFLDERITASMLVACAVVLLGTALATGGPRALRLRAPRPVEVPVRTAAKP